MPKNGKVLLEFSEGEESLRFGRFTKTRIRNYRWMERHPRRFPYKNKEIHKITLESTGKQQWRQIKGTRNEYRGYYFEKKGKQSVLTHNE